MRNNVMETKGVLSHREIDRASYYLASRGTKTLPDMNNDSVEHLLASLEQRLAKRAFDLRLVQHAQTISNRPRISMRQSAMNFLQKRRGGVSAHV